MWRAKRFPPNGFTWRASGKDGGTGLSLMRFVFGDLHVGWVGKQESDLPPRVT